VSAASVAHGEEGADDGGVDDVDSDSGSELLPLVVDCLGCREEECIIVVVNQTPEPRAPLFFKFHGTKQTVHEELLSDKTSVGVNVTGGTLPVNHRDS
jgi:hypothetical protein